MRGRYSVKIVNIASALGVALLSALAPRLNAQTIQNPSFETPVVGPVGNFASFQLDPTGAVWTFSGRAGIAANGSTLAHSPFSTNGNQIAFLGQLSASGASMAQTISNFPAGLHKYSVTFMASALQSQSPTVRVLMDGTNVGSFSPQGGNWSSFQTMPIPLGGGAHVLSFTNVPSAPEVMLDTIGLLAELPVKIAAGSTHSLFVTSDGSLWGMGANRSGQLGNGTTQDQEVPEQIVASNVMAIAAGNLHSLFLKNDGSLWAMGYDLLGQLGDGTNSTEVSVPEQIVASNVTAIAGGGAHSLFLQNDGSLWAMGNDQSGQLGDGIVNSIYNPAETNLPEMIVASNVTAIAAGFNHSLFLKSDGSLWGMGANNYGQLGDGTYNSTNRPELIVAGGVTAIAAGSFHSLFLKSDGSLWAMGSDVFGLLGDGIYNGINNDTNSTNEPELIVPGPPGYDQISIQPLTGGTVLLSFLGMAGANYALDYTPNLAPPCWMPVATNPAGGGGLLMLTNTPDPTTNTFWRIRSVP
ncbi:MAG: hypothetical protein ABSE16_17850 [Verrucomicrobiota bacterium]